MKRFGEGQSCACACSFGHVKFRVHDLAECAKGEGEIGQNSDTVFFVGIRSCEADDNAGPNVIGP